LFRRRWSQVSLSDIIVERYQVPIHDMVAGQDILRHSMIIRALHNRKNTFVAYHTRRPKERSYHDMVRYARQNIRYSNVWRIHRDPVFWPGKANTWVSMKCLNSYWTRAGRVASLIAYPHVQVGGATYGRFHVVSRIACLLCCST
jgi:hypothetical protein